MKFEAGKSIFFSKGSYSDYGIEGHYKVLKDFSEQEIFLLAKSILEEADALEEAEDIWYKSRLAWAKANIDLTEEEVRTTYQTEWSVLYHHPMMKEWEKDNPRPEPINSALSVFISRLEVLEIIELLKIEEIYINDYNGLKDIMKKCS